MTPIEEVAHIANVRIELEVQLDRRWMKLSDILALEEGSIIEMNRSAGENIDIFIGRKLAAFGRLHGAGHSEERQQSCRTEYIFSD